MSDVSNQETIPFQEPPESMPTREDRSVFLLIVQGIHVFSTACALIGTVPYLIFFAFAMFHLFRGVELNYPKGEFWFFLFCTSYIILLPAALFLYAIGRGLGLFVRNKRSRPITEINGRVIEVCVCLVIVTWLMFSTFYGEAFK